MPAEVHLGLARTPRTIKGYNVVHWTENGMSYWAISDLAAAKLEDFVRLFRATPAEL
jgi:anti-sigma factor RsiW